MYHPTADLLFPHGLIGELRDLRGPAWADLVDHVLSLDEADPDSLAFLLMMVELGECLKCSSESYKFMQGCAVCGSRMIRCFKGSDEDLLLRFEQARRRIQEEYPTVAPLYPPSPPSPSRIEFTHPVS